MRNIARVVCVAGVGAVAAWACAPGGGGSGSECDVFGGQVSGSPSVEIGTGSQAFIPVANNGRWLSGYGQQIGMHLWLSVKTQGVGPSVQVSYRMLEMDGGVIETASRSVCLQASGTGGQEGVGILAFMPNSLPEACSRILCHGPFRFEVTVKDSKGNTASDGRDVSGVDVGESEETREPPPCSPGEAGDGGPLVRCDVDAGTN